MLYHRIDPGRAMCTADLTEQSGLRGALRELRDTYRQLDRELEDFGNPRVPRFLRTVSASVIAACLHPFLLRCPILAHSNTIGPGVLRKVKGLQALYRDLGGSMTIYGDPGGPRLIQAIADGVAAPSATIVPTGSTLREIERLATICDVDATICLQGDFAGFARGAMHHIPLCIVDAAPGDAGNPAADLARASARYNQPLLYVTAGRTNPMQTVIDAVAVVRAVREANPDAIILVDTAYVEYCDLTQAELTPLALENDRVIILTPASKTLFHAGLAAGWMVIGDAELRAKVQRVAFPYPIPGIAAHMLPRLLAAQREIGQARAEVRKALDILVSGLGGLLDSSKIIAGPCPWVTIDAGDEAGRLVDYLRDHGILVQRQSGLGPSLPANFIRISATVYDEARTIVAALRRFYGRR